MRSLSGFLLAPSLALLAVACAAPEPAPAPPAPPAPDEPRPLLVLSGNALVLPEPVRFETGSDALLAESAAVLEQVRATLYATPAITLLRIEGHTDTDGVAVENQRLSERRALAVARWLVGHGVDCRRLLPVGFGDTRPVAANDSPQNKGLNRRIEFVVVALRDRPIAGGSQSGASPLDGGGTVAGDPCR